MENKVVAVADKLPEVVAVADKLPEMGGGIMDHWIGIVVGLVVVCGVGYMIWKKMKKKGL